jgi:hypothetical protein
MAEQTGLTLSIFIPQNPEKWCKMRRLDSETQDSFEEHDQSPVSNVGTGVDGAVAVEAINPE